MKGYIKEVIQGKLFKDDNYNSTPVPIKNKE